MDGFIHSIDTFGTVDGPGARFVVFMQGCPLRCAYCHNPDTWQINIGKKMSVKKLYEKYNSCKEFVKGGVTITGGEALLQKEFVAEFFALCKKNNIHTCLDTSGIVFTKENASDFDKLLNLTDLVLLDIKHIDEKEHKKLTGQSNKNVLEFAEYLSEKGIKTWIRHVVVPKVNMNEDALFNLGYYIGGLKNIASLEVLEYNTLGVDKYKELGINYTLNDVKEPTKQEAIDAKNKIIEGIKARIAM